MSDDTNNRRERIFRWTVIDGDRLAVTSLILGLIFLLSITLLALNLFPRAPSDPIFLLLSAFLGGNLTLITVVIAINQLVFSREPGSPGELESRTRNAVAYRNDVESVLDRDISPVMPGSFLLLLHEHSRRSPPNSERPFRILPTMPTTETKTNSPRRSMRSSSHSSGISRVS